MVMIVKHQQLSRPGWRQSLSRLIVIGRLALPDMLARDMATDGLCDAGERRVHVHPGWFGDRPVVVGGGQPIGRGLVVTLLHGRSVRDGNFRGAKTAVLQMADMAKSLERDAQLESVLGLRSRELGLEIGENMGRSLSHTLADSVPFDHGRDLGMSR
jgi:hypothetical protein